jgi:hypothetical protein
VKSRRFVCNDPRVLQRLEQFIPTADNPDRYRLVRNTSAEQALEYRLLYEAMKQTGARRGMEGDRIRLGPIEAIDGTPVADIKAVLSEAMDS